MTIGPGSRGYRRPAISMPRPVCFGIGIADRRRKVKHLFQLFVSERAVERHVTCIFSKLGLPTTEQDHRRVLAVLAFLRG
jgi:hypothetical protein